MRPAPCLALALALFGCDERSASERTPTARTERRGPAAADPCAALRAEAAALRAAGGRCARDSECACFQTPWRCGGVSDRKTVGKLATVTRMARLSRCRPTVRCVSRPCRVACVGGRCVGSAHAVTAPSAGP